MMKQMRMLALVATLFAGLIASQSRAANIWQGPQGDNFGGQVELCLNSSGQAVPTFSANGTYQCAGTQSFSASISGFRPSTYGTPISAITGGTTGALPAGTEVVATNVGTFGAFCKLGASVDTSGQYLSPGGAWFAFAIAGDTQLTCEGVGGTTTINMAGGSGLPTGTGGGGGGSSSSIISWAGGTLGAMANYGTSPGAVLVPGVNAFVTNTNANGQTTMSNSSPVTIASDQSAIPVTPAAGTTGGTVQYHLIAANTTNSTSVKVGAGVVYSIQTGNIGASAPAYLKFYDKATAPTCNTDTVVKTILIPANSLGGGNNVSIPVGAGFTSGIGICVTGGIADNDNTSIAASTVIINIGYK